MNQNAICVDNSIAVKWATKSGEHNWEEARHFLALWQRNATRLIAPPVFDGELRAALHRKVQDNQISEDEQLHGLHLVRSLVEIETHPDLPYVAFAFERYLKARDTYDTMYLALAALNGCELWTHDDRWKDSVTNADLTRVLG